MLDDSLLNEAKRQTGSLITIIKGHLEDGFIGDMAWISMSRAYYVPEVESQYRDISLSLDVCTYGSPFPADFAQDEYEKIKKNLFNLGITVVEVEFVHEESSRWVQ